MSVLIEREFIICNQETNVFDEYSLISDYITSQKVAEWNTEKRERKNTGRSRS